MNNSEKYLTLTQAGKMFNIYSSPTAKLFFDMIGLFPALVIKRQNTSVFPNEIYYYLEDDVIQLHNRISQEYYKKEVKSGRYNKNR